MLPHANGNVESASTLDSLFAPPLGALFFLEIRQNGFQV
jgi:hypothetical protein